MTVAATPEYLQFRDVSTMGTKTKVWLVLSARHGDQLGVISWSGAWRQYVFRPTDSIWSAGCMVAVVEFVDTANQEHAMAVRARSRPATVRSG